MKNIFKELTLVEIVIWITISVLLIVFGVGYLIYDTDIFKKEEEVDEISCEELVRKDFSKEYTEYKKEKGEDLDISFINYLVEKKYIDVEGNIDVCEITNGKLINMTGYKLEIEDTLYVVRYYNEDNIPTIIWQVDRVKDNEKTLADKLDHINKPHPEQKKSSVIGVGIDGNVVNMDLWRIQRIAKASKDIPSVKVGDWGIIYNEYDDKNEKTYLGEIVDGKIQGSIPAYIKFEDEIDFKPIKVLEGTFFREDLTEIIIPSTVKAIGISTFSGCKNLSKIIIPEEVVYIGACAFKECTSLTNIIIPSSVKIIGPEAFEGCTNLKNVTIMEGVKEIKEFAFMDCEKLENITIPKGITSIETRVFSRCKALKNVTIPESVKKIGYTIFMDCDNSLEVKIMTKKDEIPSTWEEGWDNASFYGSEKINIKYEE